MYPSLGIAWLHDINVFYMFILTEHVVWKICLFWLSGNVITGKCNSLTWDLWNTWLLFDHPHFSLPKTENLSHWGLYHDISPVIRVGKFALSHLLVVPMQLVLLSVEIPPMHPVRWLCSTAVPEWAQWYSTGVGGQSLLHQAQVLCVWRMGGGVQTPPRWCAGWWQQQCQCQQVEEFS